MQHTGEGAAQHLRRFEDLLYGCLLTFTLLLVQLQAKAWHGTAPRQVRAQRQVRHTTG